MFRQGLDDTWSQERIGDLWRHQRRGR